MRMAGLAVAMPIVILLVKHGVHKARSNLFDKKHNQYGSQTHGRCHGEFPKFGEVAEGI